MIKRIKCLFLILFVVSTVIFAHAFAEEINNDNKTIVGEWVSTDWQSSGKPHYFQIWKDYSVTHYTLKPDGSLNFSEDIRLMQSSGGVLYNKGSYVGAFNITNYYLTTWIYNEQDDTVTHMHYHTDDFSKKPATLDPDAPPAECLTSTSHFVRK